MTFCYFAQVLITSVFPSPRAHGGFLVSPGPSLGLKLTAVNSRDFSGSAFPKDRTMFEEKLLLGSLGIRCGMCDDHYRISLTDGVQVLQVSKNQMQHALPGVRFPGSEEPTFTFSQAYNRLSQIQEFQKFSELLNRLREKKRPQVLHRKY